MMQFSYMNQSSVVGLNSLKIYASSIHRGMASN